MNPQRIKFLIFTILDAAVVLTLIAALHSDYGGGFFELKVKFFICVLISLIIANQSILIAQLYGKAKGFYRGVAGGMLVTVVMLIIIEVALHAFFVSPVSAFARCDNVFHHSLVPGGSGNETNFAGEYVMSLNINSLGFRDIEHNETKCDGCFRVVMMGDSFTEGEGVQMGERFSDIAAKGLSDVYGDKVELVNMGINSNAQTLEYLWLKYKVLGLKPDMIILNIDLSDPFQDSRYLDGAEFNGSELVAVNGCSTQNNSVGLLGFFRNDILLYKMVSSLLDKMIVVTGVEIPTKEFDPSSDLLVITREQYTKSDVVEGYWNTTRFYLGKILNTSRENNITLVIVTYPWGHQVSGEEWYKGRSEFGFEPGKTYSTDPQQRIMKFCGANKLVCLDMTPSFVNSTTKNYYDYDMHWNTNGHRLAAGSMLKFIMDNHLVQIKPDVSSIVLSDAIAQ